MSTFSLRSAWARYQNQLQSHPVRTQVLTSTALWAAGDVIAQTVSARVSRSRIPETSDSYRGKHEARESGINWQRVLTTSGFGTCFVGPAGHLWYEGLEYLVKDKLRLRPNSVSFIATKLAADALIFGPIHLLAFFTYIGVTAGKSWDAVKGDLKKEFIPAFLTEGMVWPVVQVINFKYVPVRHQLLFVNVFCLLDSAFLSWFKYQDDAPWKRYLLSLVTGADGGAEVKKRGQ